MSKLKLGPIADDKPVKVALKLAAALHRDLTAYAAYLNSRHVFVLLAGEFAWLN